MVSMIDEDGNIANSLAKDIISKKNLIALTNKNSNIKPSYYAEKEHAGLHRVLLCSALKLLCQKLMPKLEKIFLSQIC